MSRVIKVGVIGCGEIAQWMHLPFLAELPGFQATAVCDISPLVVRQVGERFGIEQQFTDVNTMLEHGDFEAVVIATPIHSDPAIAAAKAGKHVLVEKPMADNLADAEAMVAAAADAHVTLMVGYMKRYDPGYRYGQKLMREMNDVYLIRVHDLNGPNAAFMANLTSTLRDPAVEAEHGAAIRADIRRRVEVAIGTGHPESVYHAYGFLGGLSSHDITIMRGAFGNPRAITHAEIWRGGQSILATLDYGDGRRAVFETGNTKKKEFDEELVAFGERGSVAVRFPSPYVKYAPTIVEITEQEGDALVKRCVTASYEEAFRRELEHFHECIVSGKEPETSGRDSIEDVRLQIEMIKAALR
jgi:predicted dehydrogenase